jgi:hypothetical protein
MLTSKTESRTSWILKRGIGASRSVETVFESCIDCWRRLAYSIAEAFESWSATPTVLRIWVAWLSPTNNAGRKEAAVAAAAVVVALGTRLDHEDGQEENLQRPSPWSAKPFEGGHYEQPYGARLPTSLE